MVQSPIHMYLPPVNIPANPLGGRRLQNIYVFPAMLNSVLFIYILACT